MSVENSNVPDSASDVVDSLVDGVKDKGEDALKDFLKNFKWLEDLQDMPIIGPYIKSIFDKSTEERDELAQSLTPYNSEYILNHPEEFVDLLGNNDLLPQVARISEELQISPNLITAISTIESNHNVGAERFEKHVFDRYIRKGKSEEEATMLATSYGEFQIMGFNYKVAGYDSVSDFVSNMKMGNRATQFDAFASFVKNNEKLHMAMKGNPDFETIARMYNGPQHAKNNYVEKLKTHFHAEPGKLMA